VLADGSVLYLNGLYGTARYFQYQTPLIDIVTFLSPANDTGTLTFNSTTNTYTYTQANQTVWTFDLFARQVTRQEKQEAVPRTSSWSLWLLTGATWQDGARATYTYDGGLLALAEAPGGRRVTFTHDAASNLTGYAPDGSLRTFTYDDKHRLLSDTHGSVRDASYDSTNGRLVQVDRGGGVVQTVSAAATRGLQTSTARNASEGAAQLTDGLSRTTAVEMDRLGRVKRRVHPDDSSETWQRDTAGHPTVHVDPATRARPTPTTAAGNLTRIDYPDSSNSQYGYGSQNELLWVRDTLGNRTTISYTANLQIATVTDALNGVTTQTWDNGQRTSVTDPLGHTTAFNYDTDRRLQSVTDALGGRTTYTHDAAGNVTSVTDALGHTTTFTHDGLRRVLTETDAAGGVTTYGYDAQGHVTTQTDPSGLRTDYGYDAQGRLVNVVEAVGTALARTTTQSYDAAEHLVSRTDALGRTTAYTHDEMGRVLTVTHPGGAVETFSYNSVGERLTHTDELGRLTWLEYDVRGRVVEVHDALARRRGDDGLRQRGQRRRHGRSPEQPHLFAYDALNRMVDPRRSTAWRARSTTRRAT
jgi:YD repeat-containing protein